MDDEAGSAGDVLPRHILYVAFEGVLVGEPVARLGVEVER